jgi:mannosylglycerate hydrolase
MFSTGIRTRVSHADSHFDVVERPIPLPDCDDWKEPVVGTYPFRSFVDLTDGKHGIAFIGEGLQEFEVMDDESRTLAISLVRSVRIKLEVSEQRKQELPDVGAQCQGSQMFRWALFPHAGRWDEAECPREALHFLTPPVAVQFGKNRSGNQPRRRSFVELDSRILVMSAMKLGPKGNSLIVRVYNPSDRSAHGSLRFEIPVKRAWQVSLNEERTNPENVVRGSVLKLLVAAKKIVTYELVFRRR